MTLRRILGGIKGRLVGSWQARHLFGGLTGSLRFMAIAPSQTHRIFQGNYHKLPFLMRWSDWHAVNEVLLCNEYKVIIDCLKDIEQPRVLDLGANIGTFSLFVFSLFPKAAVEAYEAAGSTYQVIAQTRKLNPACDWTVHHAAAYREDGEVSFDVSAFSTGGRISTGGKECVPARSLASILSAFQGNQVHLAKIDIEGAEEALLAGHAEALKQIDHLIIEIHPGRCDTALVVDTLRQAYNHVYQISGRASSKPLLLASRQTFSLPPYTGTGN